jgi:putative nucleotide binding protein
MSSEVFGGRGKPKIEYYGYILDIFEDERMIRTFEYKGGRRVERRSLVRGRIAQVVGEKHFILFEVLLKPESKADILDRVYIGPGPKDDVELIIQRIRYDDLTGMAKTMLEEAVKKILLATEERWIEFFNKAGPITPKLHTLELLPHIGKKKMWVIIKERESKPFSDFKDIEERTGIDPVKALWGRILEEMMYEQKYYLFVHAKK